MDKIDGVNINRWQRLFRWRQMQKVNEDKREEGKDDSILQEVKLKVK